MKKSMFLIFTITFVSTFLLGCQSEDNTAKMEEQTEALAKKDAEKIEVDNQLDESQEKLKLDGEIIKVSISNLEANETIDFEDDETIEMFTNLISQAVKKNGIVSMVSPKFTISVVYNNENKQSFNLWIGNKGGQSSIMDTDDTHTIYIVSEDMTGKLIDLIEPW